MIQVEQMEVMLPLVISVGNRHIVTVLILQVGVILFHAQHLHTLKVVGSRHAQNRLRHHTLGTVIIVSNPFARIVVITREDGTDFLLAQPKNAAR